MFNNKVKKYLLVGSLLFNVLFVLFFLGKRFYYGHWSLFHHVQTLEERWTEYFNSKPNTGEVLFLGTSITEGFPVMKEFRDPKVKNMGFAGSISINGIQFINRLIYRKPAKIFLEFGVNDLKFNIKPDTIKAHLKEMLEIIKTKSPNTKVYVQSVLPTAIDTLNQKIKSYNLQAEEVCSENNISFINLYPAFLRGNNIDQDLTFDGIHLTETGYFLWRSLIIDRVNKD